MNKTHRLPAHVRYVCASAIDACPCSHMLTSAKALEQSCRGYVPLEAAICSEPSSVEPSWKRAQIDLEALRLGLEVSEHRTGGQRQVQGDGVLQSNGVQRQRLLRGARRRPAMSTRGVRQGDCQWRDAPLHRARWREALPAQGLLQGIASRDTAALRRARRREAVPPGGLLEARSRRRRAVLLRARRRQAVST